MRRKNWESKANVAFTSNVPFYESDSSAYYSFDENNKYANNSQFTVA